MKILVTEEEIKMLVKESVRKMLSLDEDFGYGMDENFFGGFDETAKKRPAPPKDDEDNGRSQSNNNSSGMERKRNIVVNAFSNTNGKSDVKRRGAIELLYHPKDDGEWDTYRSEFSKYLDPNDTAHVWDDSQINKLYNWLGDIL